MSACQASWQTLVPRTRVAPAEGAHLLRALGPRRWHTRVLATCFPPSPSSCLTSHCRGSLVRAPRTFTPFFTLALWGEDGQECPGLVPGLPRGPRSTMLPPLVSFWFLYFFRISDPDPGHPGWQSWGRDLPPDRGIVSSLSSSEGEGKGPLDGPPSRKGPSRAARREASLPGLVGLNQGQLPCRGHQVMSEDIFVCLSRRGCCHPAAEAGDAAQRPTMHGAAPAGRAHQRAHGAWCTSPGFGEHAGLPTL